MPPSSETSPPEPAASPSPDLTHLPDDHWDTVFTPDPAIRHPWAFLAGMLADLKGSRELAWRLFLRNIMAQYRQTFLGWFWAFAPVLVTTATFVFLQKRAILTIPDGAVPYAIYLFAGMLLWQTFYEALLAPIKQVTAAKSMLAKIHFPREALLLAGVWETLFNTCLRLLLWIPASIFLGHNPLAVSVYFLPGLLLLIGLGTGIGVLLVPLAALYQDVEKGLPLLLNLGLFLTPVLYPIPENTTSLFFLANPATALLDLARSGLLGVSPSLPGAALIWGLLVGVGIGGGWIFFRISLPHLISRMPAS